MPSNELKFRVWDMENKEFCYFDGVNRNRLSPVNIDYLIGLGGHIHDRYGCPISEDIFIVHQFTGKKDEDGKEIYAGDIMDVGYSGGHERDSSYDWHGNFEVKFDDGGWVIANKEGNHFLYMPEYIKPGIYSFKVVGNIFENKKLMEDE